MVVTWSRSAPVEVYKANTLQEPCGLLNGSAKEFLTPNESSAPDGSVKLNISGHVLHEKDLQRKIGVVTLFSSQERRALAVSVINW